MVISPAFVRATKFDWGIGPMRQAKLQDACEEIVDNVDGALGCALVDLATGLPLALDVKPGSLLNASSMELMSAAGGTYFQDNLASPGLGAIEDGTAHARDVVQKIQATTEDTYHFMSLVPGEQQELLILITDRRSSNLGLGWMAMRQALQLVEDANGNSASVNPGMPAAESTPPITPPQPARASSEFANQRARGRRTIWGQR